jgi:hypothetical protein
MPQFWVDCNEVSLELLSRVIRVILTKFEVFSVLFVDRGIVVVFQVQGFINKPDRNNNARVIKEVPL